MPDETTVAMLTDLWPSRSEPYAGRFVAGQVAALAPDFRHAVLVPRLVAPAFHRRIWGDAVQGWQGERIEPAPPSRLLAYPMVRLPKASEVRVRGARAALCRAGERPRLVHGHFLFGVGPAAVALAASLGVPSLLTAHGTDSRWLADGGVQERHRRRMLQACLAADRVVAVSQPIADALASAGVDPDRIEEIPMGIDESVFRPSPREESRAALGLAVDVRVVLFVGRMTQAKGIEVLDRALGTLDGVVGLAAGPGTPPSTRIRSLGVLEPEPLAQAMAAADVVCLPSFAEGTPVSIAEALAAGRPVVASAVGGIPRQVVPDENGLLVGPGDPNELAAALEDALSRAWSTEAIRASSRRYWWSTVAGRLRMLYEDLLQ